MTRLILVATDGSASGTAAVEWAATEAATQDAGLRVLHVLEPFPRGLEIPRDYVERAREDGEKVLDGAAGLAAAVASGLSVTMELRTGAVAETILAEAADADEIVLGSRGRGGFASLMVGSVSLKVAGHTAKPVVVVRRTPVGRHRLIVVGYDRSETARRALDDAFARAERSGARLRVVNVWTTPVLTAYGYTGSLTDVVAEEKEAVRAEVEPWLRAHPDVEARVDIVVGHPIWILRDASKEADLVVVGSRGRGALKAALLGSVSHGVLHHATSPVAVVGGAA